ncbi:cell division protein ZapB [Candidatus Dependentiae bacterium]|nr:MAG: cell division protein ZapB [Candidatus Dependentiae bacterium]
MDALQLLEQKISSLVDRVKALQEEHGRLRADVGNLDKENKELKAENAKFAEENMQLFAKVGDLEKRALEGNDQIDELNQEKALTKLAVDDLLDRLKSIDVLVEMQ